MSGFAAQLKQDGALKEDIIDAIARHMLVKPEAVKVKIDRRAEVSILRIAVDIPA